MIIRRKRFHSKSRNAEGKSSAKGLNDAHLFLHSFINAQPFSKLRHFPQVSSLMLFFRKVATARRWQCPIENSHADWQRDFFLCPRGLFAHTSIHLLGEDHDVSLTGIIGPWIVALVVFEIRSVLPSIIGTKTRRQCNWLSFWTACTEKEW